jgi:hypothetical protein
VVETVDGRARAAELIPELWLPRKKDIPDVRKIEHAHRADRLRLAQVDTEARAGTAVVLKHDAYKEVSFRGRQWITGSKCVFEEDGSACRVQVEVPSKKSAQTFNATLDTKLYNAVRAQKVQEQTKIRDTKRKEAMRPNTPKSVGDMKVTGTKVDGKLTYTWKGLDVDVTPRKQRPEHDESGKAMTRLTRARARESTPDRALRKMLEKAKRTANRAAAGKHEPIVSRDLHPDPATMGGASQGKALDSLRDPHALAILKTYLEFMASDRLHHCPNCDEEWPVFDAEWPQTGVELAGPKAGTPPTLLIGYGWDHKRDVATAKANCDSNLAVPPTPWRFRSAGGQFLEHRHTHEHMREHTNEHTHAKAHPRAHATARLPKQISKSNWPRL